MSRIAIVKDWTICMEEWKEFTEDEVREQFARIIQTKYKFELMRIVENPDGEQEFYNAYWKKNA